MRRWKTGLWQSWTLGAALAGGLLLATTPPVAQLHVRYLRFDEARETVRLFQGSGLAGSDIRDQAEWSVWIRRQDKDVRSRVDRGVEDSISNLILYGTSYTQLPRLDGPEQALTGSGEISPAARARVAGLAAALATARSERLRFVRSFLQQHGVTSSRVERFLTDNLMRFAREELGYQTRLDQAAKSGQPDDVFVTRGTLYAHRGLSVDTSLLPNYALEDTLRVLLAKKVIAPGAIRRIAVVGPGLDFTDKRDGYDFYPLQTIQPFAVMEAALRLGLGRAADLLVITLDLNPAVNAHIARVARDAQAGRGTIVQLPRDSGWDWNTAAVSYWSHFGEFLGTPVTPLPVPAALGGVLTRAVAISPGLAARLVPLDADIVGQTVDDGPGFDLVVATNILVYYDSLQQALAMASIAHMLNRGGLFLANNVLPAQHVQSLEFLGRRSVSYSSSGAYGDDVVVYRRR